MTNPVSVIRVDRFSLSTIKEWTDGPKYIIDTKGLAEVVLAGCDLCSVVTAPSEVALHSALNHFLTNSPVTIYFVDDERMAGIAMQSRPDLDIRLLVA